MPTPIRVREVGLQGLRLLEGGIFQKKSYVACWLATAIGFSLDVAEAIKALGAGEL